MAQIALAVRQTRQVWLQGDKKEDLSFLKGAADSSGLGSRYLKKNLETLKCTITIYFSVLGFFQAWSESIYSGSSASDPTGMYDKAVKGLQKHMVRKGAVSRFELNAAFISQISGQLWRFCTFDKWFRYQHLSISWALRMGWAIWAPSHGMHILEQPHTHRTERDRTVVFEWPLEIHFNCAPLGVRTWGLSSKKQQRKLALFQHVQIDVSWTGSWKDLMGGRWWKVARQFGKGCVYPGLFIFLHVWWRKWSTWCALYLDGWPWERSTAKRGFFFWKHEKQRKTLTQTQHGEGPGQWLRNYRLVALTGRRPWSWLMQLQFWQH